ncbi:tropinone reductase like protein [Quercus suber]|uniref:Tropinone reductase like protein n=1 Tax=Quercus suber TaxID=58331 RepID=A0AAW0M8Y2_QUESU
MSQTLFPLPLAPSSSRFSSNLSKTSNLLCPHSPIFSNPTFPHPLTFHSKLRISQPTSITPIRSQPMSHSSTNSNSAPIDNPRWSLCGMTALVTSGTRRIGHAIVEELVGFEARVHTCCRNESELDGCLSGWDNLGFGVTRGNLIYSGRNLLKYS